jgi:hypothetical protein
MRDVIERDFARGRGAQAACRDAKSNRECAQGMTIRGPKHAVTLPDARVDVEEIADCPFSLSLDVTPTIFPMLESLGSGGVWLPIALLPFSPVLSRGVNVHCLRKPDRTELGRAQC